MKIFEVIQITKRIFNSIEQYKKYNLNNFNYNAEAITKFIIADVMHREIITVNKNHPLCSIYSHRDYKKYPYSFVYEFIKSLKYTGIYNSVTNKLSFIRMVYHLYKLSYSPYYSQIIISQPWHNKKKIKKYISLKDATTLFHGKIIKLVNKDDIITQEDILFVNHDKELLELRGNIVNEKSIRELVKGCYYHIYADGIIFVYKRRGRGLFCVETYDTKKYTVLKEQ